MVLINNAIFIMHSELIEYIVNCPGVDKQRYIYYAFWY